MKTRCMFAASALFFTCALFAQGRGGGVVSGLVKADSTNRPLEFVNVILLNQADSAIVTGTSTDSKGKFTIDNIPDGEYFLTYSLLGYKEKQPTLFRIDSKRPALNVGTISLVETALKLDGVTVTSQKVTFNNAIDRKVFNVQQDIMSKTGSVSELLQTIPSVQVDMEGAVSLRGSTNVLILINGKPSPLMGKSRADVLQQMPSSSIERIEVITNPSAKFKPDGTSGIINIVLKKEVSTGLNGNLTANGAAKSRYNANVSTNYNPGAFNIFGSYSFRQDDRNNYSTDTRVQRNEVTNAPSYYKEDARSSSRPLSQNVTLGLDYRLGEIDRLGVSGNYHYRGFTREDISTKILTSNSIVTNDYDRRRVDYEFEKETGITGYFEHQFKGEDHNLRLEFNAAQSPEVEDNHYTNVYRVPASPLAYDNTLNKQTEGKNQLTIDYTNRLTEHTMFEAGYDGEFNKRDMAFYGEYFDPNQRKFVEDVDRTNRFIYDEAIHAVYGTYENSFGLFSFIGGVRAEQAFIRSDLVTRDSIISNEYFNMYPTLHLAYRFSEAVQLQLNYSRRVNRPEGDDLNPFREYDDPRSIHSGNPRLKPEFIHSVEFGCELQNDNMTVVPSIFYRTKYNGFTTVVKPLNDSTLLTTRENLSSDQSAGFEMVVAGNVGNLFTANVSANAFYEQIDASNLGFGSGKSTVTWSGTLSGNVNLSKATMIQINSNYRSSRLTPQGENRPSFVVNLGFRQDLFDDKLSLIVTISDLLKTMNRKTDLNTSWLTQNVVSNRDSRIVYFGLTYHFGTPAKKSKEKELQYDNGL
ncbi:MAG: TonB-dependent receptor [Ignavibacteria bacterium]|nr:TonB-dependent receptor [Ignavibacteria bacterium]